MKISVITRHSPSNYGSLLQTIATQKILEKAGHQVRIMDYVRRDETGIKGVLIQLRRKEKWNKNPIKRLIYIMLRYPSEKIAEVKFSSMQRKYLSLTKRYTTCKELEEYAESSDSEIYMTGSDQVWGRVADKNYDPAYFLNFVPEGHKKISYAASFGKTALNEQALNEQKPFLLRYDYVTVREESAVKILEQLNIPCLGQVLDPTLLLTPEEWETMTAKNRKERYILVYQIHNNPEFGKYAKAFAKSTTLPLYRVSPSLHQIRRGGKLIYLPDIERFLSFIKGAEYIITDSFHGTAFAINFNKQFIEILTDKQTETRNISLLKLTGLENRIIKDYNDFSIKDRPINYEPVNSIIKKARETSIEALKQMMI